MTDEFEQERTVFQDDEQVVWRAKCGHIDALGYFANTYCKKCADKGHRSVMGR